ncbi:Ribophorin_II domain-containing protein [Cephalotus follicularis]|uniref:Dolichyl-diphosphooligosaccharide--protein glycosyltransferase subunit 2 n=1 Tax=Cephalotus follicularis TaxID=3775 RepID=A0A1Q3CIR4_CEPFO|nr:Ribophorin_II domain-containing protein [Cephalotus follicularis]
MGRGNLGGGFALLILVVSSIYQAAAIFHPISDSHRSAALDLFTPVHHGSFSSSLEEAYEALRTFEILGIIENKPDVGAATCHTVSETFRSTSSTSKDLYHASKVNSILKCDVDSKVFEGVVSRLQAAVSDAGSLLDFYYSIGSLVLIKDRTSKEDLHLVDAEGVFHSIKALSQSDGRWRYSSNNPESSTSAAGFALEALAGVVSLASSEIDQSMIGTTKSDILKLFDSIEKYDDGAFYFDEKVVDASDHQGPLSTTSSVVRGVMAFAAVASGSLNLPGDKILGLAKFFLGIGIPGDAKDFFNQVNSLACLESNRVSVPLILSLPATVLSLTKKTPLEVRVNTVLGSNAPPLSVNLVRASNSGSKGASIIENQELKFDPENAVYILDVLPKGVDVGKYVFVFEVVLHDSELKKVYVTGGQTQVPIFVTGVIKIDNAEVAVLDSDLGNIEIQKKLDLAGENAVSLSANHLEKLRLSFQLTTPLGHAFKPHQAILKLIHETKVEHIFMVGSSGKQFEIVLDFLGLIEKFFYFSGKYDMQLIVGDAVMENSFLQALGNVELDLPEPPEKAPRPPLPVDPYSRYGPKAEISHIFRSPEKRPAKELSLAFLGLTFLPFIGFLVGLLRLGANLKNFPTSAVPATFAILFQLGIAAVLLLYALFWLKLDLFTTLRTLGFLGAFLMFVGHRTLSHLAATSAKLKSA